MGHSKIYLSAIAVLLLLGSIFSLSPKPAERFPQSLAQDNEGVYLLANGTDGCPRVVEWSADCDGFALTVLENGKEKETHQFCKINKGLQQIKEKTSFGFRKSLIKTERKENVYSKLTTIILQDLRHSIQQQQSDTVIFDNQPRFLWEHSQDNKGLSCLYAK